MSPSLFCSENSFLLMHMFQDFFKQFMLYGHILIWTLHKCTGSQILFLIALKICLCYPFWNLIMNTQSLVLRNTRFKKYLLWLYFNLHWNITICITIVCSLTYAELLYCTCFFVCAGILFLSNTHSRKKYVTWVVSQAFWLIATKAIRF